MKLSSVQGIKCVGVPLRPSVSNPTHARDFKLVMQELSDAITEKTKVLVLNTPQTFLGKTYDREELNAIADVVRSKHESLVVLSDEVYEFMTFHEDHERFATLPEMYVDRNLAYSPIHQIEHNSGTIARFPCFQLERHSRQQDGVLDTVSLHPTSRNLSLTRRL